MNYSLRRNALGLTLLATAFTFFFQITKHQPTLASVNPFGDDPYDAVASFAVQLVLFLALLSLVRAFRPSPPGTLVPSGTVSQMRGQLMAHIAVAFTLLSDLVALIRHASLWMAKTAGHQLLALTICLLLWTAASGSLLLLSAPERAQTMNRRAWIKILVVPAIAILVLCVYPERLRQSLEGEIFTVLCGIILLFAVVWAVGTALASGTSDAPADLFDDLAAIGASLARGLGIPRMRAEAQLASLALKFFGWLNPRRHRWNIVFAVGFLLGTLLVIQELGEGGESPHGGKRLLVIAVYLGLETAGILTGYALLAEPLSLFRRD